MSSKSNTQGRAYEYASIMTLHDEISKFRYAEVVSNTSLHACKSAWQALDDAQKTIYTISARAAVENLIDLEPLIVEHTPDTLYLAIQPDSNGECGDVRDILIQRKSIKWEIGLSLKHNNFAVKHSRLATNLDFAESWFGIKCSKNYWDEVSPVFSQLNEFKNQHKKFSELPNKEETIYLPILNAFINEMCRILTIDSTTPSLLVEYLIGKFDFYKIISVDAKRYTSIQAVNIHDTLNRPSICKKSRFVIPKTQLPKRLIHIGLIPGSKTTVELYLDGGWQFTFRIHNAATMVEPSLKFDIQIVGMPTSIITINSSWS